MAFAYSHNTHTLLSFLFADKIFTSASSQVHSNANLQTGSEKKKTSHLITTSSTQSTVINGDKSVKAVDSNPNFSVPKPAFAGSKSPQMEKDSADGAQLSAGTKSAPRLPPKPSKYIVSNIVIFILRLMFWPSIVVRLRQKECIYLYFQLRNNALSSFRIQPLMTMNFLSQRARLCP